MTRKDLYSLTPRGNNVILRMMIKNVTATGIIMSADAQQPNTEYKFEVISVGPKVEDLKKGDVVFVGEAALYPMPIEDAHENEAFHYTVESFVKFKYPK